MPLPDGQRHSAFMSVHRPKSPVQPRAGRGFFFLMTSFWNVVTPVHEKLYCFGKKIN